MTENFQKRKENQRGEEPMNPEDTEQNAIDRGQDTEIAQEGQTGTDSPEAQEQYRKNGMTEI